jgi:CHAT domain-containing protein
MLIRSDGQLIYEKLLQETLEHHAKINQLVIVPDGILNYLPFDALASSTDQENREAQYLIENYVVSYRSFLTLHALMNKGRNSYDQVYVGFAPSYASEATTGQLAIRESLAPLKGARNEVERAGDMFKGRQYLDHEATEYEFKNRQNSSSILHLAMHALVDDEDPMRSRLLFSQGPDSLEDGNLNAYEIYQLRLDAELAVLSACNTGTGKINKGEGVMNLSRAFMYAGCPNIVMSLWQVQDQSSSQIMYTFFENLKKGLPKDESLREAKIKYLSTADPFQSHPAHWAAFVLLGDGQPLSRPGSPWLWIGLGGLFVVLAALYFQQRKKRKIAMERALAEQGVELID